MKRLFLSLIPIALYIIEKAIRHRTNKMVDEWARNTYRKEISDDGKQEQL